MMRKSGLLSQAATPISPKFSPVGYLEHNFTEIHKKNVCESHLGKLYKLRLKNIIMKNMNELLKLVKYNHKSR